MWATVAVRRGTFSGGDAFLQCHGFLIAPFLYQDAIGTIIANMALYAVMAMGFKKGLEITLFAALTVPAVVGSYLIGRLVDRIEPKRVHR